IRLVLPTIDSRSTAIVFARTVNRLWGEAADVFGDSPIVKERGLAGAAKVAQHELTSRNRGDHALEHLVRLRHERPVPGIQRPFTGSVAPHVARRQYVQKRDFTDAIRMVKRQSMSCARSPVVAGQKKAVITQRGHHVRLILSHGAEGIIDVLWAALRRTDTVAVAPQVCGDDVIPPGEGAGDL